MIEKMTAVSVWLTLGPVVHLCPSTEGHVGVTYEETMHLLRQHETIKGRTIDTDTMEPLARVAIPFHAVAMVTETVIERG